MEEREEENYQPRSVSEAIIHIIIVVLLTGIIFFVSQEAILYFFGEKIFLLVLFGLSLIIAINKIVKYIRKKISR